MIFLFLYIYIIIILTLTSLWWISIFKAGKISFIVWTGGGGSLFLHKFTITHVTFRRNVIGISGLINVSNGFTTPRLIT